MSNLSLYMIGAVLVSAAVAFGAHRIGLDTFWIVIIVLAILGLALMAGVPRTRHREDSPTDPPP
jgi:hypothetical protein